MSKIINIDSENDMIEFAKKMANLANYNDIFALKGSLGVGKSFFARAFIRSLTDESKNVASPTFNLVFDYDSKKGKIYHFDLYRLKSASELENIGFFEALKSGICLIEWPEIAEKFLPKQYFEIIINNTKSNLESQRKIQIIKHE